MKKELFISVVSPVFKAELIIDELVKRVVYELEKLTNNFEIILIDDGSPENCWVKITENCKKDKRIKGVKLSRNFGQHNAVLAGLVEASGDLIVIMDCDLQDDPKYIKLLVNSYYAGSQIVFTKRINRKHSFFKSFTAKIYNLIFNVFADKEYDINVGSLVLFTSQVKYEFLKIKEHNSLYIQVLKWVGFDHSYVNVEHMPRLNGKTSYSLKGLINMAIQGWVSNSEKLLYLSIKIGGCLILSSLTLVIYIVYSFLNYPYQSGWASLICTIILCSGLILTSLGILGIYLGKTYNEVKNRPNYIVELKNNVGND